MSKNGEVSQNQMVLACTPQLVPEGLYPEQDPIARISFARHLSQIALNVKSGTEPRLNDYFRAEPVFLNKGLYIPADDGRFYSAQHQVVRVGVNVPDSSRSSMKAYGVVFPSSEYATVARNPSDLARHTVSKTRNANTLSNRDEATNTAMRSAGHALIAKMTSQRQLARRIQEDVGVMRILRADLIAPPLTTRYQARNVERFRALADEKIHETVEVAGIGHGFNEVAMSGAHNVVRKKLYTGNTSSAERAFNWVRYLRFTALHELAKVEKLQISYRMCAQDLTTYQPYLDAKESKSAAEAA